MAFNFLKNLYALHYGKEGVHLWLHEAGFIMMYIILQLGVNTAF
jgi:hypothetical protein